jgi:hypothetical protein
MIWTTEDLDRAVLAIRDGTDTEGDWAVIAGIRAQLANSIFRDELVQALNERAAAWQETAKKAIVSKKGSVGDKRWAYGVADSKQYECLALADEVKAGTFPPKEGKL